jgi:hypothetical protein
MFSPPLDNVWKSIVPWWQVFLLLTCECIMLKNIHIRIFITYLIYTSNKLCHWMQMMITLQKHRIQSFLIIFIHNIYTFLSTNKRKY